nr:porin [Armatimonadota bacterium]
LEETPTAGVQDDNGRKDYILRLNYTTPNGKFNYIPAVGFGTDNTFGTGDEKTLLFDNWLTLNATKSTTLAGEYIYQRNSDSGGGFNVNQNGYGAYLRQQLTSKTAGALRYSLINSSNSSTRGMGVAPNFTAAGTNIKYQAYEVTAMYEYKLAAPLTARLEYRHDNTNNVAAFPFGTTGSPKTSQDTLTLAWLYNF